MNATLHYTEKITRSAVFSFWRKIFDWRFFVGMAASGACLLMAVVRGEFSWVVAVTGTATVLGAAFALAMYVTHYRAAMARFRRMRVPEATLEVLDSHVRVASDVGALDIAWANITELWRFPDFWLVFLSRSQFVTLPTADLDDEIRQALLARITAGGGKVV